MVDPYADLWKIANMGIQTPAQVTATANSQALARERGMLAAQKAISDQTIAAYTNQQTRAEGFAAALAKLQAGEDQQQMARYGQAADRMAGLGAGLTGAVGEQYQAGVDRTRDAVANLTGGLGEVTATPGTAIANAAQYTGATMPANTLQENAAAAARMTQSDAAARAQNIHQIGLGYGAKADDAIAQAASDARAIVAKRPETIAELVNQLNTNRQQGISNLSSVLNARTTYRQGEQKRLDDLKQQRFVNHQAAVTSKLARDTFNTNNAHWRVESDRADRQVDITENALDNTIRQTGAAILGIDPKTGMPTLSSVQANRQWQAQLAQIAQNQSAQNGYRMVWKGGKLTPQTDAKGNVVPLGGYTLTKDGQGVKKTYAPTSTGGAGGAGGLTASGWSSLVKSTQKQIIGGTKTQAGGYRYAPDDENAGKNGAPEGYILDPNKPPSLRSPTPTLERRRRRAQHGRWQAKARVSLTPSTSGENGRAYQTFAQPSRRSKGEVAASIARRVARRTTGGAQLRRYPAKLRAARYEINRLCENYMRENPTPSTSRST